MTKEWLCITPTKMKVVQQRPNSADVFACDPEAYSRPLPKGLSLQALDLQEDYLWIDMLVDFYIGEPNGFANQICCLAL